jgi:hypothetical protein
LKRKRNDRKKGKIKNTARTRKGAENKLMGYQGHLSPVEFEKRWCMLAPIHVVAGYSSSSLHPRCWRRETRRLGGCTTGLMEKHKGKEVQGDREKRWTDLFFKETA